jgi:hypothetical protein
MSESLSRREAMQSMAAATAASAFNEVPDFIEVTDNESMAETPVPDIQPLLQGLYAAKTPVEKLQRTMVEMIESGETPFQVAQHISQLLVHSHTGFDRLAFFNTFTRLIPIPMPIFKKRGKQNDIITHTETSYWNEIFHRAAGLRFSSTYQKRIAEYRHKHPKKLSAPSQHYPTAETIIQLRNIARRQQMLVRLLITSPAHSQLASLHQERAQ